MLRRSPSPPSLCLCACGVRAAVVGILDAVYFAVKDLDRGGVETWSIGDTILTLLPSLLRHLGLFLAVVQEPQYVHCLCMADLELLGRPRIFMEDAEFAGYEAVVGWAEQHRLSQMGSLGLEGAQADAAAAMCSLFPH
jgi:hypothetical protein